MTKNAKIIMQFILQDVERLQYVFSSIKSEEKILIFLKSK